MSKDEIEGLVAIALLSGGLAGLWVGFLVGYQEGWSDALKQATKDLRSFGEAVKKDLFGL